MLVFRLAFIIILLYRMWNTVLPVCLKKLYFENKNLLIGIFCLQLIVLLWRVLNWEIAAQQVSQFGFFCVSFFTHSLPVSFPSCKFLETPATQATGSKILGS